MKRTTWAVAIALVGAFLVGPIDASATVIFSDAGANAAAIQNTVDAYRAALGNPNNGNAPGPLPSGRREINWDGGGPPVINGTAPVTPFLVFQNTRGATFTTPSTGLTQAAATGGLLSLDLINPTYAALFAPFSLNRLFTPLGSNVTEGFFSIPGTGGTVPAGVRGFGAIFSDVDLADETTIEYFDIHGDPLGVFDVPAITGNQTFSFLGIIRDSSETLIGSIRIVTGTGALGPNESSTVDLVVMDDFFYGEPQRTPLPSSALLLGLALLAVAALSRFTRARIERMGVRGRAAGADDLRGGR
jgi:hypothetical protein